MPKRLFRKWCPDPATLKEHKHLQFLGNTLHATYLWHFNRKSVANACAVGLFAMWMPIPFQSVLAASLAVLFRANLPLAVVLVFITNPITMPPLIYLSYSVGTLLLGDSMQNMQFEASLEWMMASLSHTWQPFLLGTFVVAVLSAILGYYGVQLLWRWHVLKNIKTRAAVRHAKRQQALDDVFGATVVAHTHPK